METVTGDGYTIYLGDCLDILPTLAAGSVHGVIIDPPYGIDYQSARRTDRTKWKPKIANDKRPFLGWGHHAYRVTDSTGFILVFYRWDVQTSFLRELSGSGWAAKSQVIWDKESHGMGDLNGGFAPQHENILFARKAGFSFPGNRPKSILRHSRIPAEKLCHPNEKPESLMMDLIRSVTKVGDIVLDFCMGSGTTGVACMKTGRHFIGIELDPTHFHIAHKRIANAAGEYMTTTKERAAGQMALWDVMTK